MDAGKSFARTLASGDDRLTFIAEQTKSGVRVFGQLVEREKDAKGKLQETRRVRGAHDKVADMDEAKAWIAERVAERVKAGWAESTRKSFERKPDAFGLDSLPAPRRAPAPAAKPIAPVQAQGKSKAGAPARA